MAKLKKQIQAKKTEASKAKNLNSQLESFFISGARKHFIKLKQVFIEPSIPNHSDLERYIPIKMDVFGYAINKIFNQLILDNFNQWYSVVFFSRKMIPTETRYKTHNEKLLAIIKAFKTWKYYLKSCKHKVLIFTDYNNL